MSVAPALTITNDNVQVVILKSMVTNPGWFNKDQTKFED